MPRTYPGPRINLDAYDGDWIKRGRWDLERQGSGKLPRALRCRDRLHAFRGQVPAVVRHRHVGIRRVAVTPV
jgi:hypothetical protein